MRFIILIVTVLLAVVAGFVTLRLSGAPQQSETEQSVAQQSAPRGDVATVNVLVARNDILLGTVVDGTMVDVQPWPQNLVLDGFIVSGSPEAKVEGMIARGDFKAREPLMLSRLGNPNDASFLAAALAGGMRAVTVAVDPVSGVAGYVFPGDRVDVLLTHNVPQAAASQLFGEAGMMAGAGKPTTSEVLLPNVRVLAVNLRKPPQPKQQQPDGQQAPTPPAVETPANLTIELSQEDAKKLRLAEKNGTLSMALRSAKDADSEVGEPVTLIDISRVEGNAGDSKGWARRKAAARVMSGGEEVIIIRGVRAEVPMGAMGGAGVPAMMQGSAY